MIATIPGGQAELREKVTAGGRQAMLAASVDVSHGYRRCFPEQATTKIADIDPQVFQNGADGALLDAVHRYQNAGIVAFVKSWSLPQPVPTMDTVEDLDVDVYDALAAAVSPLAARAIVGEKFGADGASDPDSPTEPSAASDDGASRALTTP